MGLGDLLPPIHNGQGAPRHDYDMHVWSGEGSNGRKDEDDATCQDALDPFLTRHLRPGPRFNIKTLSYQYRKSHCGDKTVVRSSYLHNRISYTGKMNTFILNQGPG